MLYFEKSLVLLITIGFDLSDWDPFHKDPIVTLLYYRKLVMSDKC